MGCHTPTIYDYNTISEQKTFLRKRAKAALKSYCADKELMKQAAISAKNAVISSLEYKNAPLILSFMPLQDELDVSLFNQKALEDGKKLAFPKMINGTNDMDFYFATNFDNFSSQNNYGILEPEEKNKVDLEKLPKNTLILVPGLVFNLQGVRLGRGKGFYDKFLLKIQNHPEKNSFCICGVCFTICITKAVPQEQNDQKVNFILNEYGMVKVF